MNDEKEPTKKQISEIKAALEKQHGREFTEKEAIQAVWDIRHLANIGYDMIEEDVRREKLLKKNPKGMHWDEGGNCQVCGDGTTAENSWFDKNGLHCMLCSKAIRAKKISGAIGKKKDSWYSKIELESYFNIKGADLTKYLKTGVLINRFVEGATRKKHFQLFLIKDNKDFLPPKRLLQPRVVPVDRNGEKFFTTENWYEYADKKLLKKLAKYKIIHCLKDTLAKPISTGRFLWKDVNPLFSYTNRNSL
jgi:hypothetical protein